MIMLNIFLFKNLISWQQIIIKKTDFDAELKNLNKKVT